MARRVFISFLGAGIYNLCEYKGENTSTTTRFVQEAILKEIGINEWNNNDSIFILLTEKAKALNWGKTIRSRKDHNNNCIKYYGLEQALMKMSLKCNIKSIDIPDCSTYKDIWDTFDIVYSLLDNEDDVYLDLTHAFRFLPMLVLILSSYAKFLKKINIEYLAYGNYEARSKLETSTVDRAPIINLKPLIALQEWTFAAGQFIRSGNIDELIELSSKEYSILLKESRGKNQSAKDLKRFIESIKNVINEIKYCRGKSIISGQSVKETNHYYNDLNNNCILPALAPITKAILGILSEYDENGNINNLYKAAEWCYKMGLNQQSVTILKEAIISSLCYVEKLEYNTLRNRKIVEGAINFKVDPKNNNIPDDAKLISTNNTIISNDDFIKYYTQLRDLRNDYNHSGMRPNALKINSFNDKLKKCLDYFTSIFASFSNDIVNKKPILINYSNHPHRFWSYEQLSAAQQYGNEIIDIPFKKVSPQLDAHDLDDMIVEEFHRIISYSQEYQITVHIMGEMNFTFGLVNMLLNYGIKCLASTTKRIAQESANGVKESVFYFVQFREYK